MNSRTDILREAIGGIDLDRLQAADPTGYDLLILVIEGVINDISIEDLNDRAYLYKHYLEVGEIDQTYIAKKNK